MFFSFEQCYSYINSILLLYFYYINIEGEPMQQLPKGYYAIQSDMEHLEPVSKASFFYQGTWYAVTPGENVFSTLEEAALHASEIPDMVLEGLSFSAFTTPVLLFSAGRHSIDDFSFSQSLTLLGQGAGISPNLPTGDPMEAPALHPKRSQIQSESILFGSYWWGTMFLKDPNAASVLVDGFSSEYVRFQDLRTDGGHVSVSFRNIIQISPCGYTLYQFSAPEAKSSLDRQVLLQNIRITSYDDLDYGGNFILLNAHKATLDGICYDTTGQIFGLTSMARDFSNCAASFDDNEYEITNSYFRNLTGEHGISTGCYDIGDSALHLTIANTTFVNASREQEAVLTPHLANNRCSLTLSHCTFIDTRSNTGPAILSLGEGNKVTIHDCTFEGYAKAWDQAPAVPVLAPDQIENTPQGFLTATEDPHKVIGTDAWDFSALDALYEGTQVYYGDLHVHTDCGGTSDGHFPMAQWPKKMDELQLDFAAVVDHRQMRGFFLPEWDEERFIIGTEPGTAFLNLNACRHDQREVHYNMLFPHKYGLAMVLANFPEFAFHGDELTGSFSYPAFTKERFLKLTQYVQSIGGIMVHPHPKTMLSSDDPLDYYFGEHTYLETLYGNFSTHASFKNYDLWVALLALGKHVYTSCGSDTHQMVSNEVVATFYTREKSGKAFFDQMHSADFTAGAVGIQMCIDGHPMGSETAYREGMTLTLRLNHFYAPAWKPNTAYELRIYTDQGLAYASIYNGTQPQALSVHVQKRRFYRAEVYDLTHGYRVAVGNPIWLEEPNE